MKIKINTEAFVYDVIEKVHFIYKCFFLDNNSIYVIYKKRVFNIDIKFLKNL